MHLGRVYPLLEFAKGGRRDTTKLDPRGTQSVIATEAYVTVFNDWRSNLITSTTRTTLMSDTYPSITIPAGQNSGARHVSVSWIPGQSSFGLGFSPANGGPTSNMNIRIGRPPAHVTDVSFSAPFGQAGAVLAPTKAFSSFDYNMYLFGGPGILPPLINSVLDANLGALNKFLNGNPFKPAVGNDVNVAIGSLPGSIKCSYAAISPVTEGDLSRLNLNAVIDITGTIGGQLGWKGINTNFGVNLNGVSVLVQGNVDLNSLKIAITSLQFSAKGFSVSNDVLTVLEVLVPPLAVVINNPYLVAGILNANYNSNIVNAINGALAGISLPTNFQKMVTAVKTQILRAGPTKFTKTANPAQTAPKTVKAATDYSKWMTSPNIQGKTLGQIKFLGTHDSATYELQDKLSLISYPDISFLWMFDYFSNSAPANGANPIGQTPYYLGPVLGNYVLERVKRISMAQDKSILDQLKGGVRVFDLRIYYDPSDGHCYSQHGLKASRLEDILNQVKSFFDAQPSAAELVMLQISHTNFGDYPASIPYVTQLTSTILGNYIYVPSGAEGIKHFDFNSLGSKTLSSITGGKNKVILLNTDDYDSWTFATNFVNTAGFGSAGSGPMSGVSTAQALGVMDVVNNVLQAIIGGQEQWILGWYAQKNNAGLANWLKSQTGTWNLLNVDWFEVSADGILPMDVIAGLNK